MGFRDIFTKKSEEKNTVYDESVKLNDEGRPTITEVEEPKVEEPKVEEPKVEEPKETTSSLTPAPPHVPVPEPSRIFNPDLNDKDTNTPSFL